MVMSTIMDLLTRLVHGEAVPDSRQASFGVKLGGYDMQEVDAFLDDLRKGSPGLIHPLR